MRDEVELTGAQTRCAGPARGYDAPKRGASARSTTLPVPSSVMLMPLFIQHRRRANAQAAARTVARRLVVAGSCAIAVLVAAAKPLAAQTATCIATADPASLRLRTYLRALVASSDSGAVDMRTAIGLATVDSTTVSVVTDAKKCPKILAGTNAALKTPNVSRSIYVYALGKDYGVFIPGNTTTAGGIVVLLNAQYGTRDIIAAPSVH